MLGKAGGELRKFNEDLWYRTMNTQETPDLIITHCCIGMSDEALARLPSRDNIKRRIRMLRQDKKLPSSPNDPNFPNVPTALTVTSCGDKFLRSDTGSGPDRTLIFASSKQLDILQSCDDFLVDGTFKVVPEIFYQLYVVHAIYRGHVVPVVYSLLSRKNSDTYQRLINEIVEFAPCWFPGSILLDFEKACINVYDSSFVNISLSGCYVHFRQNFHRQLQALGYQNRYQDVKFAHNINKIAALAFIPPCDVLHAYSSLALHLDDDYQDILNYFEDTYIGRLRPNNIRRQPTFSIEFWNMRTRTTQLSTRTNNSVEAWHRHIGCIFQCAHPTLWSFLQKLIHEEHATHAVHIVHINSGETPKHKSKTNERFERRLLNLLLHPHDDIVMQLNNIAHNICL
ncbi:unnamed protein product [Didymodactylos carnosus]|uniref:MULE transposase domain-containing protein n=1 Tax=Didymodactylos carnosus TaxID=1234261 RepID=A0A814DSP6_9BILA|nr:unnamed protein product [Didymodactylos carnosus]CAF3733898.1 unnamed protein product [Didymodactylos carnosus]